MIRASIAVARLSCDRASSVRCASGVVDAKLKELGVTLPTPAAPKGSYVLCKRVGSMLYTAGHLPQKPDGTLFSGKVGAEVDIPTAQAAAKQVAINLLATLKEAAGSLDKVQIVKLTAFVQCVDGFPSQPMVVNAASDFLFAAMGERGRHSRSAVGVNALPLNVPVEIEAIATIVE